MITDTAPAETTAIFRRLRGLKMDLRTENKRDQTIALIGACILEGMDTRLRIVRALAQIGLNKAYVAIVLNEGTGSDSKRYHWQCDAEGRYSLQDRA